MGLYSYVWGTMDIDVWSTAADPYGVGCLAVLGEAAWLLLESCLAAAWPASGHSLENFDFALGSLFPRIQEK